MNVQLSTYDRPLMTECAHMECVRIPVTVAQMLRDRMGTPYSSSPAVTRWAGMFAVPTAGGIYRAPFELVICTRGASFRCRWDDAALISQIIDGMVPELLVTVMEVPMR